MTRTNRLILACNVRTEPEPQLLAQRRLARLQKSLATISAEITALEVTPSDVCLVRQREEQLHELKQELREISRSLITLGLDDKDEIMVLQDTLDSNIFDDSLRLKRMLEIPNIPPTPDNHGVKLPKLDVPIFNGNILHWKTFWEQFSVAVHSRADISDAEKLVYLRHSVKDGLARNMIEGLSRTGENCTEAVECLIVRYDRPRFIHQTHVKKILDVPPLKNGNGKELRYLYDTVQQHLRALRSMGYEPSGPFVTSVLELKLDAGTMFEWQKISNDSSDVPHYNKLLEFIYLRAQASEHTISEPPRKSTATEVRRSFTCKSVTNFATNTVEPCVVCKTEHHHVFSCSKFRSLDPDCRITMARTNHLCLNCLRMGHFAKQCKSLHKCRECQGLHHTLLHIGLSRNKPPDDTTQTHTSTTVSSNLASGLKSNALLMTCQAVVTSPNGLSTQARALLDSGSSTLFVSNHLAKILQLPRTKQSTRISGIAGLSHSNSSHAVTTFCISPLGCKAKQLNVSAIIIPRVTCNLPVRSVSFQPEWNHLKGLQLADPSFGVPGTIDLLLGVDIFTAALLNGRRSGAPGLPAALETIFGWVLSGNADPVSHPIALVSHHVALLSGDDLLRQFWEIEEAPSEVPVLSVEERTVMDHFVAHHSRSSEGRFVVPLPKRADVANLG